METYTGKQINPLKVKKDDFCLEDIARSLSMQCRFNGHVDKFFSVANHCVNMAEYFYSQGRYLEAKYAWGHELEESITGDIPTYIKYLPILKPFLFLARRIQRTGYTAINLFPKTPKSVKDLDDKMKILEARKIKPNSLLAKIPVDDIGIKIKVLSQRQSEKEFIEMYYKIEEALQREKSSSS